MLRHKGFTNTDNLRSFLQKIIPSDVLYSIAYYENPQAEMKEKGWQGADLVFDIDADHIPTPCAKTHNTWLCNTCGAAGRGPPPEKCHKCSGQKFNEKSWVCEVCLESAKVEVRELMEVLITDFGLSQKEMQVAFSGHRGYHLHVESEKIRDLDSLARKEIVDYIMGVGADPFLHGLEEQGKRGKSIVAGPRLSDPGWRGRIAKGTYEFLLTGSQESLQKTGLDKKTVDLLINNKDSLLESWKDKGPWGKIVDIDLESWKRIAEYGLKKQSIKIDTVVTTDVHRLIRLTNTLHGKTGLKKTQVPITNVDKFDPFKSAVAFKKGFKTVFVSEAPQFRVGDELYGPFKKQQVELPTAGAILLLCKGLAKVGDARRGV